MKEILIVDCQYDFIDGSLACGHSEEAVKNIISFINTNPDAKIFYSADNHSPKPLRKTSKSPVKGAKRQRKQDNPWKNDWDKRLFRRSTPKINRRWKRKSRKRWRFFNTSQWRRLRMTKEERGAFTRMRERERKIYTL